MVAHLLPTIEHLADDHGQDRADLLPLFVKLLLVLSDSALVDILFDRFAAELTSGFMPGYQRVRLNLRG